MATENASEQVAGVPAARSRRKLIVLIAKLAVAGGLLAWLIASGRIDFKVIGQTRHPWQLVLAALMIFLSMLLPVWRWLWLLRIQQLNVTAWTAFRLTWLGYFATLFLPGSVGGDLAKAYVACRNQPTGKTRAVSTVLMDRIIGLHMLLFLGSIAGIVILAKGGTGRQAILAWFPVVLLVIGTVALALVFWPVTSSFALKLMPRRFRGTLKDSLALYRSGWRLLVGAWLFSALSTVVTVAEFYFVGLAFDVGMSAAQAATVVPLVVVANCLPVSPGGLGVAETAASGMFGIFGVAHGASLMLVVRMGMALASLPGALAGVKQIELQE